MKKSLLVFAGALLASAQASNMPFGVITRYMPEETVTVHCEIEMPKNTEVHIAIAAIDNLGRGAAGQAVQNMNLMFGLPETAGLHFPGLFP